MRRLATNNTPGTTTVVVTITGENPGPNPYPLTHCTKILYLYSHYRFDEETQRMVVDEEELTFGCDEGKP